MKEYHARDPCKVQCRKCKKKFITNEESWYMIKDSELAKYMNEPTSVYVDCPKCTTALSEDDICKEKK